MTKKDFNDESAWMVLGGKIEDGYLTMFCNVSSMSDMQATNKAYKELKNKSGNVVAMADCTFIIDGTIGKGVWFDPATNTFVFKSEDQKQWCLEEWSSTKKNQVDDLKTTFDKLWTQGENHPSA